MHEDRGPAAGTRIARAGSVGVEDRAALLAAPPGVSPGRYVAASSMRTSEVIGQTPRSIADTEQYFDSDR